MIIFVLELRQQFRSRLTRSTTDPVHVFHDVLSGRLQVGQERNSVGYALEIVNGEVDSDRSCDCDQMKDGVGGSSEGHGDDLDSENSSIEKNLKKEKEKEKKIKRSGFVKI